MKRILIVDDEEDICRMVGRYLEMTGNYQVISTMIPEEVIPLCREKCPHMILMDIVMPGMKGTEVIARLKKDPQLRDIKIIVTSGLGEMVYHEKQEKWNWEPNRPVVRERGEVINEKNPERAAMAYGVDDFIQKPFSPQTLVQVMEGVFNRQEENQEEKADGPEE